MITELGETEVNYGGGGKREEGSKEEEEASKNESKKWVGEKTDNIDLTEE